MDYVAKLKEFHNKFDCVTNPKTTIGDKKTRRLRQALMKEELLEELIPAMEAEDIIEIADGLGDLLYVTFGLAIAYGIDIDRVFQEVHESNMTKMWSDGTVHYREDGKILKPDTYKPVDLSWVLEGIDG